MRALVCVLSWPSIEISVYLWWVSRENGLDGRERESRAGGRWGMKKRKWECKPHPLHGWQWSLQEHRSIGSRSWRWASRGCTSIREPWFDPVHLTRLRTALSPVFLSARNPICYDHTPVLLPPPLHPTPSKSKKLKNASLPIWLYVCLSSQLKILNVPNLQLS